ncbi:MAG: PxKF domain-containing protein [Chloroflexi bacterium]|nr:PxKF domain-containing protein [Chloroflexota bacterium]
MRIPKAGVWGVVVAAVVALLALASVALADNVNNNVAANPGSDTFTVGGSTSVGYKITGTGGDGQSGCNASDGSAATVTISAPAGVTPAPSSLVFTTCGVFQSVTFTASAAGDYSITVSVSDAGPGTYSTGPAAFTLHVLAPANTPPVVTVPADITAEATGPGGAVVAFVATAVDAEDGPLAPVCTPSSGTTFALGSTAVSCTATDSGGLTDTGSFTVTVEDTTPPVVTITAPADSGSYVLGAVPVLAYTVSDAVDPSPAVVVSGYSTAVGLHTVTVTATDFSGNAGSDSNSYSVTYGVCALYDQTKAVKSGSTIPIKLQLCDNSGANVSSAGVTVNAASVTKVSDSTTSDAVDSGKANPESNFRYDATLGGYIYNLSTKGLTSGTYQVDLTVSGDPVGHTVQFVVK